jgi:hypothetical protein
MVTGTTITASSRLTPVLVLSLIVTAAFAAIVIWKSDRIRHYNRVFTELENNYRYVKEERIMIDEDMPVTGGC